MPTYSNNYSRGQFGVQGGYRGTGQDLSYWSEKAMDRLLSPEEFSRLDANVRGVYGGYMSYVNAFSQRQKFKKQGTAAYQAVKAGTYEPFTRGVSYGKPTSTRGRAATGAGGVPIPRTTIHRDIRGRPTEEIAGGGVRRGAGGEVIPQTAEQYGDIADIERGLELAIPRAKEKTEIELARQAEAGIKLGDVRFQAGRTPLDRYLTSKENQAQQRLAIAENAIATRYKISGDKIKSKESLLRLKTDLNMDRDLFKSKLASGSLKEKNDFAEIMRDAKFEHDFEKQARRLNTASDMLQTRIDAAKNATEVDQLYKTKAAVEKRVAKLMYFVTNQDLTDKTEAEQAARARREALNIRSAGASGRWGTRPDGTRKGDGFLGGQKMTDGSGKVMTEYSTGTTDVTGEEMDIPTLVPTLTKEELTLLLAGKQPTKEIFRKAVAHARKRLSEGKSVFAEKGEDVQSRQPKISFTKLMTKEEFVQDFTDKKGRPPSYEETIRAEDRYWETSSAANRYSRG